jgi:hypothetical protein
MTAFLIGWMTFQKDRFKRTISTPFSDTQNRQPESGVQETTSLSYDFKLSPN